MVGKKGLIDLTRNQCMHEKKVCIGEFICRSRKNQSMTKFLFLFEFLYRLLMICLTAERVSNDLMESFC